MFDHPLALGVLAVGNIPVYVFFVKLIFNDWETFGETLADLINPEDEFSPDRVNNFYVCFKLAVFVALCAACVWGEYFLMHKFWLHR